MNYSEPCLWKKDVTASAVWKSWAMAVPWTGVPMRAFLKLVAPLSSARYVRLVSFWAPAEAPNQSPSYGPWPYTEALTMSEAANELTMLACGIYGHSAAKAARRTTAAGGALEVWFQKHQVDCQN